MTAHLESRHPEADLFRCPGCDHCFSRLLDGLPPESYDPRYFVETHRRWFAHPNLALYERLGDRISSLATDASILEVGCGTGTLLRYLRGRFPRMRLCGMDLAPDPGIPGVAFRQADLVATPVGEQYDAVLSLATIEHVSAVRTFLDRMVQACRQGGLIVVMTLDDRSVLYAAARRMASLGLSRAFERLYSKHHLNHFNASSLGRLLELAGLRLESRIHHNAPLASMDIPSPGPISGTVLRAGVLCAFVLGRLLGRTYLQTAIARKADLVSAP
jgi:SAM-dependent methyltransferase